MIHEAHACFRANVRKSYVQVLDEARFGKNTAIHMALLHEEATQTAQNFAVLNTVDVYYDVIANRWSAANPWGFFVQPEFIRGIGDTSEGTRLYLSVSSNLDPLQIERSSVLVQNFVPSDTVDSPSSHGSNSWALRLQAAHRAPSSLRKRESRGGEKEANRGQSRSSPTASVT